MQTSYLLPLFMLAIALANAEFLGPCGPRQLLCIKHQATCVVDECVCNLPKYVYGDGYFACYRRNQVAAEARNDPFLTTYNNETVDFPFPCRYMINHVRQNLKDRQRNVIGTCEMQVHSFNKRFKGKIYTHGFDVALKLTYDNGTVVARNARIYGTKNDGITFQGAHGMTLLPHGPWGTETNINYNDDANGITISNRFEPENDMSIVEANQCGLRISLVPHDENLRLGSPHIPGLSVAVNCAHDPTWLSKETTMGLPPTWQGGQLISNVLRPGLTPEQAMIIRAFETEVLQNQPDALPECTTGTDDLDTCTDTTRAAAMNSCFWMLRQPRFIKCVSKRSSFNILGLFMKCVKSFCQPTTGNTCPDVISDLQTMGCDTVRNTPILDDFISGSLCQ